MLKTRVMSRKTKKKKIAYLSDQKTTENNKNNSTDYIKMTAADNVLRQRNTTETESTNVPEETTGTIKNELDRKRIEKFKLRHEETERLLRKATGSTTHRLWTRTVIIVSVMTLVYFYTKNQTRETKFALVRENLSLRMQKLTCATEYQQAVAKFPQCMPEKCGRFVTDKLIEDIDAKPLLTMAAIVIDLANINMSEADVTIDMHSGVLSSKRRGEIDTIFRPSVYAPHIRKEHLALYNLIKSKIRFSIAEQFGVSPEQLYLAQPMILVRFTNATADSEDNEYWHERVDQQTYAFCHYTALLHLNTFNKDFKGGRFIFVDGMGENKTTAAIEPKGMRLTAFTAGAENRYYVERITEGRSYFLKMSFTCDARNEADQTQMHTMEHI